MNVYIFFNISYNFTFHINVPMSFNTHWHGEGSLILKLMSFQYSYNNCIFSFKKHRLLKSRRCYDIRIFVDRYSSVIYSLKLKEQTFIKKSSSVDDISKAFRTAKIFE